MTTDITQGEAIQAYLFLNPGSDLVSLRDGTGVPERSVGNNLYRLLKAKKISRKGTRRHYVYSLEKNADIQDEETALSLLQGYERARLGDESDSLPAEFEATPKTVLRKAPVASESSEREKPADEPPAFDVNLLKRLPASTLARMLGDMRDMERKRLEEAEKQVRLAQAQVEEAQQGLVVVEQLAASLGVPLS